MVRITGAIPLGQYQPLNWRLSNRCILNVSTYYKQPLELLKKRGYEGRELARSGRPHIVKSCPNTKLPNHWLGDSLASNIGWKISKP